MEIFWGCVAVLALAVCLFIAIVMGYKGELKTVEGRKKLARSLIPGLATAFVGAICFTANAFMDMAAVKLTEGKLIKYIESDLFDSNIEYDMFVSPDGSTYSFEVPDKYIYCEYKTHSGKTKTALSGEEIKAIEAKLIYCYTNENENKVSISNSLAKYGDYHSFYINIHDTIMRYENTNFAQVHQFGFPLSGIRYIILDKDNNIFAGGVSNGDTIEVSNAYVG